MCSQPVTMSLTLTWGTGWGEALPFSGNVILNNLRAPPAVQVHRHVSCSHSCCRPARQPWPLLWAQDGRVPWATASTAPGGLCPKPLSHGACATEPPGSSKQLVNHSLKTRVNIKPSGKHLPKDNLALVGAIAAQRIPACCCCPHSALPSGVTSLKGRHSCDSLFSTNPAPLTSSFFPQSDS